MLDTNILLDWLLDRDASHTKLIDSLLGRVKELQIPDVIIVELVYALEKFYELPRNVVLANVNKVLDEPVFNCNRNLFHRVLTDLLLTSLYHSWIALYCIMQACSKLRLYGRLIKI
jgi:predicted nucleic-acid-binding protein